MDVAYHESDAAHHIDPEHVPAAVDWLATTLPLPRAKRSSPLRS
jgi:phospholipase/carboxylesterase